MKKHLLLFLYLQCFPCFAQYPQRIVSVSVASDQILLQILNTPEARKRILALSSLADDTRYSLLPPEFLKEIPHRVGANIEQLLSLKSDLIIAASFNKPEFISMLRKLKMKVHIMEGFQSLEDLKRHTLHIGKLIGAELEAQKLIQGLTDTLVTFKRTNHTEKKILIILPDRTLVGKDTLLDDMLTFVGFKNLARDLGIVGWQKITEEKLIKIQPDYILTSAENKERDQVLELFSKSPALKNMKALKTKKVILLSPALFAAFSPRIIEVLNDLKSQMHL